MRMGDFILQGMRAACGIRWRHDMNNKMGVSSSAESYAESAILALWHALCTQDRCECPGGITQQVSNRSARVFGYEMDSLHQAV